MSAAWPSPLERACPKCGMLQESPGSTVCEQCGADLVRANVKKSAPPRAPLHVGRLLRLSSRYLLRQGVAGVTLLVSLVFRTVKVVIVMSVFIVGLSFVGEVNARVPIMKDVAATASLWVQQTKWIQQAETWGRGHLADLRQGLELLRRPSSPVVSAKKAASVKPAVQALTLKSSPSGATVKLNTKVAGKTPLTLRLAPGTYKVTVSRRGYATVTRTVVVKTGGAASLSLTLTAVSRPAPQTAPAQSAPVPQPPPTRIHGEDP